MYGFFIPNSFCICNGYNQITVISVNSITVSLSTLQFANGFDKFDMFIDGAVKTTNFFLVKLAKTMDTHVTRSFFLFFTFKC